MSSVWNTFTTETPPPPGGNVMKADCGLSNSDAWVLREIINTTLGPVFPPYAVSFDLFIPTSTFAAMPAYHYSADFIRVESITPSHSDGIFLTGHDTSGGSHGFSSGNKNWWTDSSPNNPKATPAFAADTWVRNIRVDMDGTTVAWSIGGTTVDSYSYTMGQLQAVVLGGDASNGLTGEVYYMDNFKIYAGSTIIFADDFETGSPGLNVWSGAPSLTPDNFWTEEPFGGCSIVPDPA